MGAGTWEKEKQNKNVKGVGWGVVCEGGGGGGGGIKGKDERAQGR